MFFFEGGYVCFYEINDKRNNKRTEKSDAKNTLSFQLR